MFLSLDSAAMAACIGGAQVSVCYAAPGIQQEPAEALARLAEHLDPVLITVILDFDERVMRMGFGDLAAVAILRGAGITVRSTSGLRTGLLVVDDAGFIFTPIARYLEADHRETEAPNALQFAEVAQSLKDAPPVRFDVARQVRVFEPYLQYVELNLTGAAIQRRKLAIPKVIQNLGAAEGAQSRFNTTFDLIERESELSSKHIENALKEIRDNFTPSLGKDHGRVLLKSRKALFEKRLDELRAKLEEFQAKVREKLQGSLNASRDEIVNYYVPAVLANPPDKFLGQLLSPDPTDEDARRWLRQQLEGIIPKADELIKKMELKQTYKDVTFETLNKPDFLVSLREAFPAIDWDKAYKEFQAAGEATSPVVPGGEAG
jgi:hypothetical protein